MYHVFIKKFGKVFFEWYWNHVSGCMWDVVIAVMHWLVSRLSSFWFIDIWWMTFFLIAREMIGLRIYNLFILLSCLLKHLNSIFFLHFLKDAIDLMQGHYIMSVSRDMTATSQKGGIEAIAVSAITYSYYIKFLLFLFVRFYWVPV